MLVGASLPALGLFALFGDKHLIGNNPHNLTTESLYSSNNDDELPYTISQFCAVEHLSLATYFKIRKIGQGPEETRIPGTRVVRITVKARREWHVLLEKLRTSETGRREAERRTEMARAAGRAAASSPLHVSKRRRATA